MYRSPQAHLFIEKYIKLNVTAAGFILIIFNLQAVNFLMRIGVFVVLYTITIARTFGKHPWSDFKVFLAVLIIQNEKWQFFFFFYDKERFECLNCMKIHGLMDGLSKFYFYWNHFTGNFI